MYIGNIQRIGIAIAALSRFSVTQLSLTYRDAYSIFQFLYYFSQYAVVVVVRVFSSLFSLSPPLSLLF